MSLLHTIREAQSALATINATDSANVPQNESLERFLISLPELWRQGEGRPTHAPKKRKRCRIRTRPDPFEGVWCEILVPSPPDIGTSIRNRLDSGASYNEDVAEYARTQVQSRINRVPEAQTE